MRAFGRIVGLIKFVLLPFLFSIILLLLYEVHTAVVRTAILTSGASYSTPVFLGIEDSVGSPIVSERGLRESQSNGDISPVIVGNEIVWLRVNATSKSKFTLFHNQTPAKGQNWYKIDGKYRAELTPGLNNFTIAKTSDHLWMPFGSRSQPARVTDFYNSYKMIDLFGFIGMEVPEIKLRQEISIIYDPDKNLDNQDENQIAVFSQGGLASSLKYLNGIELSHSKASIETQELTKTIERKLKITRNSESDVIAVSANVCLPNWHLMVRENNLREMNVSQFLFRYFDTQLGKWSRVQEYQVDRSKPTIEQQKNSSCTNISVNQSFEAVSLSISGNSHETSFLSFPDDELELININPDRMSGWLSDNAEISGSAMRWRGKSESTRSIYNEVHLMYSADGSFRSFDNSTKRPQTTTSGKSGTLQKLVTILDSFPIWTQRIIYGLTPFLPIFIVIYIIRLPNFPISRLTRRYVYNGLVALLIFGGLFVFSPVVSNFTMSVVFKSELSQLIWIDREQSARYSMFTVTAIMAAILIPTLLRYNDTESKSTRTIKSYIYQYLALLISIALIIIGTFLIAAILQLHSDESLNLWFFFLCWMSIGIATFWIPVYALMYSVVKVDKLFRPAFGAAFLIFFLMVIGEIFSFAVHHLSEFAYGLSADFYWEWAASLLQGAAKVVVGVSGWVPYVIIGTVVYLLIRGFYLVAIYLTEGDKEMRTYGLSTRQIQRIKLVNEWLAFKKYKWLWLVSLIGLILLPMTSFEAAIGPEQNSRISSLIRILFEFTPLLAIFGVYVILTEINRIKSDQFKESAFSLPESVYYLIGVIFAGYICLWHQHPIAVLVVFPLSWLIFINFVIMKNRDFHRDCFDDELGVRFATFRQENKLLEDMETNLNNRLVNGEIGFADRKRELKKIETQRQSTINTLGIKPAEVNKRLFSFGPLDSPLANAMLGAKWGLYMGVLVLIVSPVAPAITSNSIAIDILSDPGYRILKGFDGPSIMLNVLSTLINSLWIWIVSGFVYGYSFHAIKGHTGFAKSIYFCGAIAFAYILSQLMLPRDLPDYDLSNRLFPVMAFIIVLGTIVFDGKTLLRSGLKVKALRDFYGLPTLVGFASVAAGLASVQSLLNLIGLGKSG